MALLPILLGAHACGAFAASQFQQSSAGDLECLCFHVVGVATKAVVTPSRIARILAWFAHSTQFRKPMVFDVLGPQRSSQSVSCELRMAS